LHLKEETLIFFPNLASPIPSQHIELDKASMIIANFNHKSSNGQFSPSRNSSIFHPRKYRILVAENLCS